MLIVADELKILLKVMNKILLPRNLNGFKSSFWFLASQILQFLNFSHQFKNNFYGFSIKFKINIL